MTNNKILATFAIILSISAAVYSHPTPSPSCREVAQMITPCVAYLADRAWAPYGPCCNGVAALNQTAAASLEHRIAVCNCMKSIAPRFPMVDLTRAQVLPRAYGVLDINVTRSPSADCDSLASP